MAIFYQRLSSTIVEMSPESIEYHIASVMIENIHSIYDISIGRKRLISQIILCRMI